MALAPTAVAAADINLSGGWGTLWGAVTSGFPALPGMLTFVGTAIVVFAVGKWAWERRRGGGMGNHQNVWGALFVGAVLLAPSVLLPLLLLILDGVANIGVSAFKAMTSHAG